MHRESDVSIPNYKLQDFLGEGGYGKVWRASGPGGVPCAIKFIDLGSNAGLKELKSVGLVKKLRHPNLVPLHAVWLMDKEGNLLSDGENGESPLSMNFLMYGDKKLVIAMGLGDGSLLNKLEAARTEKAADALPGGLSLKRLLSYMQDAARGIDCLNDPPAHGNPQVKPLVHCDIKPANLLVVGGGVQVCDYGVAKAVGQDAKKTMAAGTAAYASPELINNDPGLRSDQYSLAVSYYELRTGRLPLDENKAMWAHLMGLLDFKGVPPDEAEVLRRATSMRVADRYPTCDEFVEELRVAAGSTLTVTGVQRPALNRPSPGPDTAFEINLPPITPPEPPKPRPTSDVLRPDGCPVAGYTLERLLGQGGFGQVWQALDRDKLPCALKVLRDVQGRGHAEYKALVRLKSLYHPHLLRIEELWVLDEHWAPIPAEQLDQPDGRPARRLVIRTPLADKNLHQRLKECLKQRQPGIPPAELVRALRQAAVALDYLNIDQQTQHRDVKPENLLLKGETLWVSDFGLAKVVPAGAVVAQSTNSGMTQEYASPEVLTDRQVTDRSDQYSLAVTYHVLRTGRLPYPDGLSLLELIKARATGSLDLRDVPPAEGAVLRRALSAHPGDRFPTCRELMKALAQAAGLSASASGPMVPTAEDTLSDALPPPAPPASARLGRPNGTIQFGDPAAVGFDSTGTQPTDTLAVSAAVLDSGPVSTRRPAATAPAPQTTWKPEPAAPPAKAPWKPAGKPPAGKPGKRVLAGVAAAVVGLGGATVLALRPAGPEGVATADTHTGDPSPPDPVPTPVTTDTPPAGGGGTAQPPPVKTPDQPPPRADAVADARAAAAAGQPAAAVVKALDARAGDGPAPAAAVRLREPWQVVAGLSAEDPQPLTPAELVALHAALQATLGDGLPAEDADLLRKYHARELARRAAAAVARFDHDTDWAAVKAALADADGADPWVRAGRAEAELETDRTTGWDAAEPAGFAAYLRAVKLHRAGDPAAADALAALPLDPAGWANPRRAGVVAAALLQAVDAVRGPAGASPPFPDARQEAVGRWLVAGEAAAGLAGPAVRPARERMAVDLVTLAAARPDLRAAAGPAGRLAADSDAVKNMPPARRVQFLAALADTRPADPAGRLAAVAAVGRLLAEARRDTVPPAVIGRDLPGRLSEAGLATLLGPAPTPEVKAAAAGLLAAAGADQFRHRFKAADPKAGPAAAAARAADLYGRAFRLGGTPAHAAWQGVVLLLGGDDAKGLPADARAAAADPKAGPAGELFAGLTAPARAATAADKLRAALGHLRTAVTQAERNPADHRDELAVGYHEAGKRAVALANARDVTDRDTRRGLLADAVGWGTKLDALDPERVDGLTIVGCALEDRGWLLREPVELPARCGPGGPYAQAEAAFGKALLRSAGDRSATLMDRGRNLFKWAEDQCQLRRWRGGPDRSQPDPDRLQRARAYLEQAAREAVPGSALHAEAVYWLAELAALLYEATAEPPAAQDALAAFDRLNKLAGPAAKEFRDLAPPQLAWLHKAEGERLALAGLAAEAGKHAAALDQLAPAFASAAEAAEVRADAWEVRRRANPSAPALPADLAALTQPLRDPAQAADRPALRVRLLTLLADSRFNRARLPAADPDPAGAVDAARAAVAVADAARLGGPDRATAVGTLGRLHFDVGNADPAARPQHFPKAKEPLLEAVRLDPDRVLGWRWRYALGGVELAEFLDLEPKDARRAATPAALAYGYLREAADLGYKKPEVQADDAEQAAYAAMSQNLLTAYTRVGDFFARTRGPGKPQGPQVLWRLAALDLRDFMAGSPRPTPADRTEAGELAAAWPAARRDLPPDQQRVGDQIAGRVKRIVTR